MGNLAVRGLGRPGDSVKRAVPVKRFLRLCIVPRAAHRRVSRPRRLCSAAGLARAGTGKLAVFFDEDFDGNPCKPNSEQRNREEDNFPFHAAKLGGSVRFTGR